MTAAARRPTLLVLAGVNGAGKSSVAGERLRAAGLDYFNPDEATRRLRDSGWREAEANEQARCFGRDQLKAAISDGSNFAIETTLGGRTLPALIAQACATHEVTIWFVGLDSPERHIARVAARVSQGGHPIPESRIRERWDAARKNLIALLPRVHALWVYDNSEECADGASANPILILHYKAGRIVAPSANRIQATPEWAKPIVEAAMRIASNRRKGELWVPREVA
ncbi:MAG: AAA family ATPase [Rhodanobacteraceae bacterium]